MEIFDPNKKTFEEILKEFDVTIDINKGRSVNLQEESNGDDKTQESGGPDDGDSLG